MQQPDFLQTDELVPWCWGHGNQVWSMMQAAMQGDLTSLRALVMADPSLVHSACRYRTPLHFAVRENQLEAAKWLLEHGADGTYVSGQYWHDNPLVMSQDRGHEEMAHMIATKLQEDYGICPAGDEIADAIRSRDIKLTNALIATHGVHVADRFGNQPLHWAVLTRQIPLIDWLLDLEADINASRPDGARPVHLTGGDYWYRASRDLDPAALKNHFMLTGYLLAQGAEYDIATATMVGDIERVRQLLESEPELANAVPPYNNGYTGFPLKCAAQAGYGDIVRLLLEYGADPNQPERGLAPWGSALYFAIAGGHSDIAMLLLEQGTDPNQEIESSGNCLDVARGDIMRNLLLDRGGRRDIHTCCHDNHAEDLRLIFQQQPQLANDAGSFAAAAHRGYREIVAVFLQYQPDLWQRMPARLGESAEIRGWMLEQGMQPENGDWLGVHGLHYDVRSHDPAIFNLWLSLGVDIDVVDEEHCSTPLGWAAKHGELEGVRALLRRGANPNACGQPWALPLAWARRRGHVEIAEELVAAGGVES